MENTTFEHNKHGCHLDTVEENDVLIYLVSFLGSLAVLPGNIISALFMEKIGRVKIIGDFTVCKSDYERSQMFLIEYLVKTFANE